MILLDQSEQIKSIYDQFMETDILDRAFRAANGDKFKILFVGKWQEAGYSSQSEADLAFACQLAFWTCKDSSQMDRYFRCSGLMREKWDEKHYGDGRTYGQATVQQAIANCSETYHSGDGGHGMTSNLQIEPQVLSVFSAAELEKKEFPPVRWIVPDLLPEGLAMLAGKPKKGKSWMALNIAIATATGGIALGKNIEPGKVLYLALEDGQRRIKERVVKLLSPEEGFPRDLYFVDTAKFPRFNKGGLEMLLLWLDVNSETRLVVIDTLGRIMPQQGRNQSQYHHEYDFLGLLQQEAIKRRLCILLIHHTRKSPSDDPFDTVSGTLGITGALDTILVLKDSQTDRATAILHASGREIAFQDYALSFKDGIWSMMGDASNYTAQESKSKILFFLQESGPQSPKNISAAIGITQNTIYQHLFKLKTDGMVQQDSKKRYFLKKP